MHLKKQEVNGLHLKKQEVNGLHLKEQEVNGLHLKEQEANGLPLTELLNQNWPHCLVLHRKISFNCMSRLRDTRSRVSKEFISAQLVLRNTDNKSMVSQMQELE